MYLNNFHFYNHKNNLYSKPIKGLQGYEVGYGFSFNGKERDNETYGEGNAYDFGARIYNSRLGKWLSTDPAASQYVSLSPYNFVSNSPIMLVEIDGMVFDLTNLTIAERKKYDYNIKMLKSSKLLSYYYQQLERSNRVYTVKTGKIGKEGGGSYDPATGTVRFVTISAYIVAEELFHAYQDDGEFYPNMKKSISHIEAEGDVMAQYVGNESNSLTPYKGDWIKELFETEPTVDLVTTPLYKQMFNKATDLRIESYKPRAVAGEDVKGYIMPNSNDSPKAIIKVFKEVDATENKLQGPKLENGNYYEN